MKHTNGKREKTALASAVALVTAASVAVGGLFSSPKDLLREDADLPQHAYTDTLLPDNDDDDDGDTDELDTGEKLRRRGGLRALMRDRILRLPLIVRLAVILPLWLLGSGILALFSALWSAAAPLAQGLLGFLLQAVLLLGLFLLGVKAVFPDLPLKKILNKKSVPILLLAAAALAAADSILAFAWPEYGGLRRAVISCGFLLVLASAVISFSLREKKRRALAPPPEQPEPEQRPPDKLSFTDPGGDFTLSMKKLSK